MEDWSIQEIRPMKVSKACQVEMDLEGIESQLQKLTGQKDLCLRLLDVQMLQLVHLFVRKISQNIRYSKITQVKFRNTLVYLI